MPFKMKLHTQIFLSIILGVFAGIIFPEASKLIEPLGDVFIRLLRMIIVPLVFASLVVGVTSLGNIQNLGRLGFKTMLYYLSTTFLAVVTGLFMVNLIQPGNGAFESLLLDPIDSLPSTDISWVSVFTDIVPENIFTAVVEEKMMGLIFFSIIFGAALTALGNTSKPITLLIKALNDIMLKLTEWVLIIAPIGVFALVATLVAKTGFAAFKPLALYMTTVLISLAVHLFSISVILISFSRYSPITFFKNMFPAAATGFSTDSSVATLPVTMDCLEKNVGVPKKIVGFVTPLGATINMDGTALYEAVAAIFIAQAYGVELTLLQQAAICVTATLASIGAAGIPSAGLVTLVIVLRTVNLPIEGIGLLLAVDRLLDMCRTVVNIMGDACGSIVIATLHNERLRRRKS